MRRARGPRQPRCARPIYSAGAGALAAYPPLVRPGAGIRDLRGLPWWSIDNQTSSDLDQLEVAEPLPDNATKVQARYRHGALNIETIETRPVVPHGEVVDVVRRARNRATELIEDFMFAANEVVARMLSRAGSDVD